MTLASRALFAGTPYAIYLFADGRRFQSPWGTD
jgi:hypothetical protein